VVVVGHVKVIDAVIGGNFSIGDIDLGCLAVLLGSLRPAAGPDVDV
jgi:hypothetical protein